MTASHQGPTQGRVRWRRFGAMLTLSTAASVGMLAMVAEGALATNMTVSGGQFKVKATKLEATGFVQYGSVTQRFWGPDDGEHGNELENPPGIATDETDDRNRRLTMLPITTSAMKDAYLTNLCQSVLVKIPGFDTFVTLRITAGDAGKRVHGTNMTVDLTQLDGSNAVFTNMEIGNDASTVTKAGDMPNGKGQGFPSMFAQQADGLIVDGLEQTAWATTAGSFTLPNLKLKLVMGKKECFG